MIVTEDSLLWYNVGQFGAAGFAIPNWADNRFTLNARMFELVNLIGQNTFSIMLTRDADLSTPPTINTLVDIHQLYKRCAVLIGGWVVPDSELRFKSTHVSPAGDMWKVYPCPYFDVRNTYLRSWGQLMLNLQSELMQNTNNAVEYEISMSVADIVRKYMDRVYRDMAVRLFGKTKEQVSVPNFLLTDADFKAYNPSEWHTSLEMVDTVPNYDHIFTENQLKPLRAGIRVGHLPATIQPYPMGLRELTASAGVTGSAPSAAPTMWGSTTGTSV